MTAGLALPDQTPRRLAKEAAAARVSGGIGAGPPAARTAR